MSLNLTLYHPFLKGCLLCLGWCQQKLWIVEKRIVGFISDGRTEQRLWEYIIFEKLSAKSYFDAGLICIWHHDHRQLVDFLSLRYAFACSPLYPILFFFHLQSNHFLILFFVPIKSVPCFFISEIERVSSHAGRYWASSVQMHLPGKVQQVLCPC